MRTRAIAVLTAVAVLTGACGGGGGSDDDSSGDGAALPEAVALYGYGPQDDDSVTYQPDVVLIGGGPAAIRSVSDDGMVWTMDADADGIDELEEGKVMFASSAAAGRVIELDDNGDTVDVTLAPVSLTEVIRDAHLQLEESVPLESLTFREIPDLPGAMDETEADTVADESAAPAPDDDLTLVLPAVELVAARGARPAPAEGPGEVSTTVSGWSLTAYRTDTTLGVRAGHGLKERNLESGLKIDLDAHLEIDALQVTADVPITRGVVGQSNFAVEGITGLEVSIQGGAGNGLSDNRNVKFELPVQLTRPVIVGGFPAVLTQKFKLLFQTAFTAQNGNLSASASWDIDGPLGFDGSTLTTPKVSQRGTEVVDSIEGVSIGVNGLVVAMAFEFGLLFGVPVAGAGPVASLVLSLGLVNGSEVGLVKCRQATETATLTAGVGINLFDPVRNQLKKRFGIDIPKQTTLITETILEKTRYVPRVEVCKL